MCISVFNNVSKEDAQICNRRKDKKRSFLVLRVLRFSNLIHTRGTFLSSFYDIM